MSLNPMTIYADTAIIPDKAYRADENDEDIIEYERYPYLQSAIGGTLFLEEANLTAILEYNIAGYFSKEAEPPSYP